MTRQKIKVTSIAGDYSYEIMQRPTPWLSTAFPAMKTYDSVTAMAGDIYTNLNPEETISIKGLCPKIKSQLTKKLLNLNPKLQITNLLQTIYLDVTEQIKFTIQILKEKRFKYALVDLVVGI